MGMKRLAVLSILLVLDHAASADVGQLAAVAASAALKSPVFAQLNPGAALGLAYPHTPTGGTLYTAHVPLVHLDDGTALGLGLGADLDDQRAGVGVELDRFHGRRDGYSVDAQVVSPALGVTPAGGTTSYEPAAGLEVVVSIGFCMR